VVKETPCRSHSLRDQCVITGCGRRQHGPGPLKAGRASAGRGGKADGPSPGLTVQNTLAKHKIPSILLTSLHHCVLTVLLLPWPAISRSRCPTKQFTRIWIIIYIVHAEVPFSYACTACSGGRSRVAGPHATEVVRTAWLSCQFCAVRRRSVLSTRGAFGAAAQPAEVVVQAGNGLIDHTRTCAAAVRWPKA
jgi:hypothetical protein